MNNEIIYFVNNNKNFEKHIKECVYIKPKNKKNEKSEISSNELSEEESEKNIHKKKKKNVKNKISCDESSEEESEKIKYKKKKSDA